MNLFICLASMRDVVMKLNLSIKNERIKRLIEKYKTTISQLKIDYKYVDANSYFEVAGMLDGLKVEIDAIWT